MKLILLFFLLSISCILFGQTPCDTGCIDKLLRKSFSLQTEMPDSAYALAEEAEKAALQLDYAKGLGQAYMRMGSVLNMYGKTDSAIHYFSKVYSIRLSLKDYSGAASACEKLSDAYNSKSMKDSAFFQLYQGLKIAELSKDSGSILKLFVSLGNLYEEYNDLPSAKDNYAHAKEIALRRSIPQELSLVYGGLGNYYYRTKDFHASIKYFRLQENLMQTMRNRVGSAETKANIALCYQELKIVARAKEYYQKALLEYQNLGLKNNMSILYYNLGSLFYESKELDSAILFLEKSLRLSQENGYIDLVASCNQMLSTVYAAKGDYYHAFKFKEEFSLLQDSLLNTDKVKMISEMQTKYDTEKKLQEISLLQQRNKTKHAERNVFIVGTTLFLLLAVAIFLGLIKTRKAKKQSEDLLLNILPEEIAKELKLHGHAEAREFTDVSVLFTDFKDFTQLSELLNPQELVEMLNFCFTHFDYIITKHAIEKIKTIGDSYMAAGGIPIPNPASAYHTVSAALEMQSFINEFNIQMLEKGAPPIRMRCGIHTGTIVAGIVGKKKYSYDIWGDTVNTASRMESSGEAGRVNISGDTYKLISPYFHCSYRGKVQAKNKGEIDMYFVDHEISPMHPVII